VTWGLWGVDHTAGTNQSWFHISPHDLPEGTALTPGGGKSPYLDTYALGGFDGVQNHVWMDRLENVGGWRGNHVYRVEPSHPPRLWDENNPSMGWVAPSARIVRKYPESILGDVGQAIDEHEDDNDDASTFNSEYFLHDWDARNRTASRTAMPAPLPKGITFHHHPTDDTIPTQPWPAEPDQQVPHFFAPAVEARHDGRTVGHLEWDPYPYSEDEDEPTPIVNMIKVHPDYRRHGIATALWDFARQHEPELQHSEFRTGLGDQWVQHEQSRNAHRTAMPTWYHLTDDPDFRLDPDREPANYNNIRQFGKGVFLTQRPDEWAYTEEDGGWSGDRPYVAEIDAPEDLHDKLEVWHDPHSVRPDDPFPGSDEIFVPHYHLHKLRVKNVRPRKARTMAAAVTVYTKPSCPQCDMTHKLLDRLGVDHDTVDVTTDPDAHAYVTGLGYASAPVVVVNDGEAHWSGFRPEHLRGLVG